MAGWTLVPALVSLRAAIDQIAPDRDRRSDGSVGDLAHQQEVSDHNPDETGSVPIHDPDHANEVHAIDVDDDLRALKMQQLVDFLVARCRAGTERRLRYIIYNRTIWSAAAGWRPRPYTGASPHTEHAHFSASYDTYLEASTTSWHLEEVPVALTDQDKDWLAAEIRTAVDQRLTAFFVRTAQPAPNDKTVTSRIGRDALDQGVPNPIRGGKTAAWLLLGDIAEAVRDALPSPQG